ncbi:hypothetical protein KBA41_10255 [Candidatus Ozemobacteraceae bacterium]|nr:hypothetical protein [Candidatus Ozemobacteraceae bacterium]
MKKLLLLILMVSCMQNASACSLAIHDWQLRCFLRFSPDVTILPLSDANVLHERVTEGSIKTVYRLEKPTFYGVALNILLTIFGGHDSPVNWILVSSGNGLVDIAAREGGSTAVLGSDQHSLKLALFSDRNSRNRCHQLVLYETKRIRAIHPHPERPWAEESVGTAWVSLVFFEYPVPESILSLSAFPLHEKIEDLYANLPFIKSLVRMGTLKRRPGAEYTPESKEIPPMPE